jgi:hypothetical protein
MGRAKEIVVKVIPAKIANEFVKKHHYSNKSVNSVLLHFGCFLDEKLHGVMQFGNPINKKNVIGLVYNTNWNEFLELNRMAFDDYLPKYSESRCFSIAIKLIKKNAPNIKWILSFSDAAQCGDGSIYRASGFLLTDIKKNTGIIKMKDGLITHTTAFMPGLKGATAIKRKYNWNEGKTMKKQLNELGAIALEGYQLRYIYLIDKTCKITVPILPFEKIDELGAGMYKGKKITLQERRATLSEEVDLNATS